MTIHIWRSRKTRLLIQKIIEYTSTCYSRLKELEHFLKEHLPISSCSSYFYIHLQSCTMHRYQNLYIKNSQEPKHFVAILIIVLHKQAPWLKLFWEIQTFVGFRGFVELAPSIKKNLFLYWNFLTFDLFVGHTSIFWVVDNDTSFNGRLLWN